ncbi:MAG TPA: YegP family protein [Oscillospiraceae bacterium]|nr:YegP family protein [Oscillospiraceae bacterium]
MAGKFILARGRSGRYQFSLKATNGQIIASGGPFPSLEACRNCVERVRRYARAATEDQTAPGFQALDDPKYEIYLDGEGRFRFRLRAEDGEVVAAGDAYKAKASCRNGIDAIGRNAPDAMLIIGE